MRADEGDARADDHRTFDAHAHPSADDGTAVLQPPPARSVAPLPPGRSPADGRDGETLSVHRVLTGRCRTVSATSPSIVGSHVLRTTVITTADPVGCRFYFYSGRIPGDRRHRAAHVRDGRAPRTRRSLATAAAGSELVRTQRSRAGCRRGRSTAPRSTARTARGTGPACSPRAGIWSSCTASRTTRRSMRSRSREAVAPKFD